MTAPPIFPRSSPCSSPSPQPRTLDELLHAVTNMLSVISMHSQYLLDLPEVAAPAGGELAAIHEEAERAVRLLRQIPAALAQHPLEAR